MKKIPLLLAAAAFCMTAILSCDEIKDAVFKAFTADMAEVTLTIPAANDTTQSVTLGAQSVYYNIDSVIREATDHNFSLNDINTVNAEEVTITILDPDANNNFANFEDATLTLYSSSNSTPFEIAHFTNNPDEYSDSKTLTVDNTVNLKSYMTGTEFFYTATGKLRRGTTKDLNIQIKMKLKIDK